MTQILLTNDDGIQACGLRALMDALRDIATLSVVAPSQERSASAQSITLRHPIYCQQIAEREWAVEGTPTDAVILALNRLLPERPDLVVSGINRGGNLGENVYYSGTVAAAMEAAIHRIPSFAISVSYRGSDFAYEEAAQFARRLAQLILKEGLPEGVTLNVNFPQPCHGAVRLTRQSQKITRNVIRETADPGGRPCYSLDEQLVTEAVDAASDYAAVFAGAVSITPLELNRTHGASLNHLSRWARQLEFGRARRGE